MCSTRSPTRRRARPRPSATSAPCESPASSMPWPIGNVRGSGAARPSASVGGSTASGGSLPEPTPGGAAADPAGPDLAAWLRGHPPVDARESLSIAIVLAELERLDRPLDGDADLTHVTASGIVVGPRGTVLHRHPRPPPWG